MKCIPSKIPSKKYIAPYWPQSCSSNPLFISPLSYPSLSTAQCYPLTKHADCYADHHIWEDTASEWCGVEVCTSAHVTRYTGEFEICETDILRTWNLILTVHAIKGFNNWVICWLFMSNPPPIRLQWGAELPLALQHSYTRSVSTQFQNIQVSHRCLYSQPIIICDTEISNLIKMECLKCGWNSKHCC